VEKRVYRRYLLGVVPLGNHPCKPISIGCSLNPTTHDYLLFLRVIDLREPFKKKCSSSGLILIAPKKNTFLRIACLRKLTSIPQNSFP
jgi:hypothetical protein